MNQRLLGIDLFSGQYCCAVVVIVKHGVAMTECAALDILPGQRIGVPSSNRLPNASMFAAAPVDAFA